MMNYNAESRLRAIAMNAIREAMLVQNRWDKPFTDDDAARMHDIFMLLHLQEVASENEHASLAPAGQKPVSDNVMKIADLLENETAYQAEPLVKAVLPKARAAQ